MQYGKDREGTLISSYFPTLEEFMLLLGTKIRTVRYFGNIEDEKAVIFLNAHTNENPENGFEIIQILFEKLL